MKICSRKKVKDKNKMSLTKVKGNMYSWTTHQWNPLCGACPHGCSYCSTKKFMRYPGVKKKYSGPPYLSVKELLSIHMGKDKVIFVCSQNDLFAKEISFRITNAIITQCHMFNNTYLFQSKNPSRFKEFKFPEKTILCTTIETNRIYPEYMGKAPLPFLRATAMGDLLRVKKYLTIEPIMDFDLSELIDLVKMVNPEQVNIGADSGNNHLPEPSKEKLLKLIIELKDITKINAKHNLERLLKC